jgi:hypothetical protein
VFKVTARETHAQERHGVARQCRPSVVFLIPTDLLQVYRISKETMEHECVARVNNVKALDVAFLDQRIRRYERDIINMVGLPSENRCWRDGVCVV